MLDDHLGEDGWCPCPHCRLSRRRGISGYMHRYDDIHAEDVSWSFKVFCRCWRCRVVRRHLAQRVIRA
jgi:hypothetical protein